MDHLTRKDTHQEIQNPSEMDTQKQPYQLIDMQEKHFNHIYRIADKQLGQDYVTDTFLHQAITDKHNYVARVAINKDTHQVLGFCISFIIQSEDVSDLLNIDQDLIPISLLDPPQLGVVKTIAIDKNHKGLGIGTALIRDALHAFQTRDISSIFTIAWKSKLGINLHGVLMKTGFKHVFEIPHFWYQSSLESGCHCSVCGKPPCECSAVIYLHKKS